MEKNEMQYRRSALRIKAVMVIGESQLNYAGGDFKQTINW
jgi:hypothetical protein